MTTTPSLDSIKRSVSVEAGQQNIVALAPLRWNLIKLQHSWDDKITLAINANNQQQQELMKQHQQTLANHTKKKNQAFIKAKSKIPLHKRLAQMQLSYENLSNSHQHSRAESLKRRLDPMVAGFYKKELKQHITKSRNKTKQIITTQQTQQAELLIKNQRNLQTLLSKKDQQLKVQRRKNPKSENDPFSIHYAAAHGEISRLDVLLTRDKVKYNIDARDPDTGWTALHFASRSGHVKFAEKLLHICKANVNALTPNNETALHLAAGWGTKQMVGLLLQVGADKTMLDNRDRSALDLATLNMRPDIANLLSRWLPVGLTFEQREALSAPPPDELIDEPDHQIKAQMRTLDMKINLSGRTHIGLIHTYNKLAKMYRESNPPRYDEAIDALKRVVEIQEVNCSDSKIPLAEAMNNLGELCHLSKQMEDAEHYLRGSYEISLAEFGEGSNSFLPCLRNYALILLENGKSEGAIGLLKQYESLMHKICYSSELMVPSMDMVDVYDLLSYAYMLYKDFKTAVGYLDKGSDIAIFHHGEEVEEMAWRHDKLAFLQFCDGDSVKAEATWLKVKDMLLRFRGGNEFHEDVMKIARNCAVCACSRRPDF